MEWQAKHNMEIQLIKICQVFISIKKMEWFVISVPNWGCALGQTI